MSEPLREPNTITKSDVEASKPRLLPPYHVIIENDDYHSFEFVIAVLCKALGYSVERASLFTLEAHNSGQAVVWTGAKEVAENLREPAQQAVESVKQTAQEGVEHTKDEGTSAAIEMDAKPCSVMTAAASERLEIRRRR